MAYLLAADVLLGLHLIFVAFVLAGGALVVRWPWVKWVHLPAVAWGACSEFTGWICPLTPLENDLLRAAGASGYAGDFIGHYLLAALYPVGLTRQVQWALGTLALAVNVAMYAFVWRRKRRMA